MARKITDINEYYQIVDNYSAAMFPYVDDQVKTKEINMQDILEATKARDDFVHTLIV